ncbi:AI-2E family transporter [Sandaracinus amylolyticus]|uniref:AI-2E family transporter n=1 Tax=Sandaracinus amylolyticus TaxID=927083 RepID=UPI001F3F2DA3|nr:AI-2E family transporter [Sandaracinus amylolyticus]UJR79579.1 putative PurR-regulated permease PerM [Sandaracinus amylolyticus]
MAGTDGSGRAARTAMFPRWLVVLLGLLAVGGTVYVLRGVLTPIALSLGIAYLLDPLVDRFEARGVPRGAAITLVLAIVAAVMVVFTLLVLPGMVREVVHFATELPGEMQELLARVEPWLTARGIPVPHDLEEALAQFEIAPGELASHAAAPAQAVLRFVLGGTASAIGALASALIVPVLAFYLLYDFDRMTVGARELVPPRIRPWVVEVASEIDAVLGQFVRGQLLVMLAMGVLYAGAYSLVGVRLAVPIGLVAGLLAFIPYVGSGSALAMGLLMCVVDWTGWMKPALVVVAYLVCQGLEGFVIVPRVVGDKVGLPAVWVLVALMVGGELFGFLGVLLAVPAAAVVKIFVVRGLRWYKQSPLYLEGQGVERVAEVVQRTEAPAGEPPAPIASVPDIAQEIAPVIPVAAAPPSDAAPVANDAGPTLPTSPDAPVPPERDEEDADDDEEGQR